MTKNKNHFVLGVLGGLGPIASARFLYNVYRDFGVDNPEQEMPRILLCSDPTYPDRTENFLKGSDEKIVAMAIRDIRNLIRSGADKVMACCYTFHHILPKLPEDIRRHMISLPSLALQQVRERKEKALLLCTSGSRKLGVFENDQNWSAAQDYLIYPNDEDQIKIHDIIYTLKQNLDPSEALKKLEEVLRVYDCSTWILGCTELHLLSNPQTRVAHSQVQYIDALAIMAAQLKSNSF